MLSNFIYRKDMKCIINGIIVAGAIFMVSCSAPKKVPYMVNAETIPAEVLAQVNPITEPVVMPGDLLNIEVSSINMTAVAPFNKGRYVNNEGEIVDNSRSTTANGKNESSTRYYLVSKDGDIDFPIIGKLHIGGMDKSQIEELIQSELCPKYLKEKPSVDIRFMNFRVTMLGAVNSPGVIVSDNERLNILEAIAKAGDLNIKGERERIMLIRTNSDGKREIAILNLNDKNILLSPYYNLQQNDIIYVQPNKSMAQSAWQMNPAVAATITVVGGLSSVASLVIGIVNLNN